MRVRVSLERERGEFCSGYARRESVGDLYLTWRTNENRRVAVLQLLGATGKFPNLYEPRLTKLSGTTMRFIGFERIEYAWVMQEWICEMA